MRKLAVATVTLALMLVAVASADARKIQLGSYKCYDLTTIGYLYQGGFTLKKHGHYKARDGHKGGRYKLKNHRHKLVFTTGYYHDFYGTPAPPDNGRPVIEIHVKGDPDADQDCSRSK